MKPFSVHACHGVKKTPFLAPDTSVRYLYTLYRKHHLRQNLMDFLSHFPDQYRGAWVGKKYFSSIYHRHSLNAVQFYQRKIFLIKINKLWGRKKTVDIIYRSPICFINLFIFGTCVITYFEIRAPTKMHAKSLGAQLLKV